MLVDHLIARSSVLDDLGMKLNRFAHSTFKYCTWVKALTAGNYLLSSGSQNQEFIFFHVVCTTITEPREHIVMLMCS